MRKRGPLALREVNERREAALPAAAPDPRRGWSTRPRATAPGFGFAPTSTRHSPGDRATLPRRAGGALATVGRALVCLSLLVAAVTPALGSRLEDLKQAWATEAERLDRQFADHAASVAAQDRAVEALEAARRAVDQALVDPKVPVAEMRRLEESLARARDAALRSAEDAASLRARIYDTLEEMERLASAMKGPTDAELAVDPGVAGYWRAEWDDSGDFGLVKLDTKGNLVSGTYRLTDGRRGTLSGTATDHELRLQIIDGVTGRTGSATLAIAPGGHLAEGPYMRSDLATDRVAAGRIELRRLDSAEARESLERVR